jgi:hypothetical protein
MESGLGSFASALGYYGFAFLMVLWMVIKIARGSAVMAILTFFIWPLALVSLVRNWGNPDTDIRIPFFATVLALGLSVFMVSRGLDKTMIEAAPYFSEEELVLIEEENPEAYAKIMQARAEFVAAGGDLDSLEYSDDDDYYDDSDEWEEEVPRPARRPARAPSEIASGGNGQLPEPATPAATLDPIIELAQTAAALSYLYGRIDWPQAHAHIQLPSRFRFIPANRLHKLARLRSQPLQTGTLGWITHETVDLGQPEAWVMEVRFVGAGHLRPAEPGESFESVLPGLAGAPLIDGSSRSLGSGAFAPRWDASRTLLTWSLDAPEGESEQRAVVPLRQGALLFLVQGLESDQREFGLRASRLMAASVGVDPDWTWDFAKRGSDIAADISLLQWVQGREPALLPKPVTAP